MEMHMLLENIKICSTSIAG